MDIDPLHLVQTFFQMLEKFIKTVPFQSIWTLNLHQIL